MRTKYSACSLPILDLKDAITTGNASVDEKIIFHLGEKEYQPNKTAKAGQMRQILLFCWAGGLQERNKISQDAGFIAASLSHLTLTGVTAAIIGTYRAVHSI